MRPAVEYGLLTGAALLMLAMCIDSQQSHGHSWYPSECCSGQDCAPVPEAEISERGAWFRYKDVEFPKQSTKQSPDDQYHVCYVKPPGMGGQPFIRCMWRPHRGV